jgi:uncharacterized repeat protein (TIGR01451 family)
MFEGLAAKFTAAPAQYPYTINRIRVLGCGGGADAYGVQIYADSGTEAPGALLWNGNIYMLDGGNVYNDILMSMEPSPPPPITSGTIRVYLISHNLFSNPIGFAADTSGIQSQRNFLVNNSGQWSYAESGGLTGDWILRLGIDTAATADVSVTITDGQAQAVPGQPVTYTIVAANAGPDAVTGAKVTTTLPATLVSPTWTCAASAGSSCAASGTGSINDTAGLLASGTLTYTLTATINPTATGTLTSTATINLASGATDPNPANNTASDTDTLVPPSTAGRFFTLTPCRVVDTRAGSGAPIGGPALQAQIPRTFALAGRCGVPATARAVSLNVTVTSPGADGNLRLYPAGLTVPLVSTLNYVTGQTRANNAVVVLNGSGELAVFAGQSTGTTVEVIIDVNGYFE